MEYFKVISKIGEGSFGYVVKAVSRLDGTTVAIKKIKPQPNMGGKQSGTLEGIPYTTLRETSMLKLLSIHPNIVALKQVIMTNDDSNKLNLALVFDFYPMNLSDYLENQVRDLPSSTVYCLFKQINDGILFAHSKHIIHRDLKPDNIMLSSDLQIKIGDFGLSKHMGFPVMKHTQEVVTLWYRAPEILLGTTYYDTSIDMWSMGCILAQLVTRRPLFMGRDVIDQIDKIARVLGLIPKTLSNIYPRLSMLNLPQHYTFSLNRVIPTIDPFYKLITLLLAFDTQERYSAAQVTTWLLENMSLFGFSG